MTEHDQYRVVGPNHHQDGQRVPEGTVLDADEIADGILRNFPTKFEPVSSDADDRAEPETSAALDEPEEPATDEVPDTATEDTDKPDVEDVQVEVVQESDDESEDSEDESEGDAEYTREDLESMTRNERVQIAKESDNPDIDGRSSDDDIIAALTDE